MKNLLLALFLIGACNDALSQKSIGLITDQGSSCPGYVLYAPLYSRQTFLIDKAGNPVHTWKSKALPGQAAYLLPNGDLLRAGNDTGRYYGVGGGLIEKLDWNSVVKWSYVISDAKQRQHHDVCALPNGNILVLVWEGKSAEDAIKSGRDPNKLGKGIWSEKVVELKPIGKNAAEIVWEWHIWDHLVQDLDPSKANFGVVEKSPGLLNINFQASEAEDWLHFNSIDYNPDLDQIMISNRNLAEIYIIDHSTNKKEAAGHTGGKSNRGGDILFRWGNPAAYNSGLKENQTLFNQHNAHWIEKGLNDAGKIMIFNNGLERLDGDYSSVEVLNPVRETNGTYPKEEGKSYSKEVTWQYRHEKRDFFYSRDKSSAQRLSNGNTLICEGASGRFFEIDANKNVVWMYVNPYTHKGTLKEGELIDGNLVFKCILYDRSYKGLKGKILKPIPVPEK